MTGFKTFVDVNSVLPMLIKTVCETYPTDRIRPSVLTSYIEERSKYYVSAVRYVGTGQKEIITSAYGVTLVEALIEVSRAFLKISSQPYWREALRDLLA